MVDHRSLFPRFIKVTHALPKPSPETLAWNERRRPLYTSLRYPTTLMIKRPGEKKYKNFITS